MASENTSTTIQYSERRDIPVGNIVRLYEANGWSSAQKSTELANALANSHSLVSAWVNKDLVGLGNAISDGHLVVYYPHLLVHPDYQGQGIGTQLMKRLMANYSSFHQHMVVADAGAVEFYRKCGFSRAGKTEPMWIYDGHDH